MNRTIDTKKHGFSGGQATYGLVDDLTFSYPVQSSQLESVASAAEGTDFYGRVGFPLSGSQYTWNDAGLMASDSGFGITAITYNDFGLPVKFHTQDRKAYTAYSYSADGALLQKEVSTSTSSPFPFTSKSETTYSAGRIFYSATRSNPLGTYVSYFPGGYFDSNGGVHYMHLDYQGSVVMETDSAGHIEKHRGYYPYGEPWAEATNKKPLAASVVQPQTYQSKERTAATGDYDFGPRRYISAAPFWRAPDPKAHDYPNISPYAFCGGNPVGRTELDGKEWEIVNDEKTSKLSVIWVDPKNAYDRSGNLKPNTYKMAVSFSEEGASKEYDSKQSFNIGSSLCTVYKEDGTTESFDACTYPSDTGKYATVPEGQYEAKVGKHNNSYTALRMGDKGTTNFYNNKISLDGPNPSNKNVNYISGANIHKAGKQNFTGIGKDGRAVSQACLLIDRDSWDKFMNLFNNNKQVIGITISR